MLGTLRFRLTALFLATVLVFGLASIAFAVRLFQDVTRSQSVSEIQREARGIAALYAQSALRSNQEGAKGQPGRTPPARVGRRDRARRPSSLVARATAPGARARAHTRDPGGRDR